jgi:exosome complex RNA-binding protein Rrp42 (RNase PH superfamily)
MKKTPSIIPQEEEVVIEEDVVPAHSNMNQQIFKSKMIDLLKLIIKKKE